MGEMVDRIRGYILETFLFGGNGDSLGDDDSFLENGIIDSTGILELVAWIEETYGIRVADDELVPENLDSVNRLAAYVGSKGAFS
jgi:acyl carrier protein